MMKGAENMSKRLLSALVAFCMALTLMPSWALADEPADDGLSEDPAAVETPAEPEENEEEDGASAPETPVVPEKEKETIEIELTADVDLPDGGESLESYLSTIFPGLFGDADDGVDTLANLAGEAGSPLNANEKKFYDLVRADIEAVADGTKTSTVFTYDHDDGIDTWGNMLIDGTGSWQKIVNCLNVDCAASLYWADRGATAETPPEHQRESFRLNISGTADSQGGPMTAVTSVTLTILVDFKYSSDGKIGTTTVAKNAMNVAAAAITNAQEIVDANSGKSDYEKLYTYMTEICRLVEYNHDALTGTIETHSEGPWQLIWVFDKDETTNVVCEGYAKAFQLLCDLTEWEDNTIKSHIVSGPMGGGTGEGPHMWNIVTVGDQNYLVDVTNCDSNSIGSPDKLFMAGIPYSQEEGRYRLDFDEDNFITYNYDPKTTGLYQNTGILNLSASDYVPPHSLKGTISITGAPKYNEILTAAYTKGEGENDSSATWKWLQDGTEISGASGTTYRLTVNDIGKHISAKVTIEEASKISNAVGPVEKADGPAAPTNATATSTYNSITVTATPSADYEYAIQSSADIRWQNSNTFTGLNEGTTYTILIRVKETNTTKPGTIGSMTATTKGALSANSFQVDTPTVVYDGAAKSTTVTAPDGVIPTVTYRQNGQIVASPTNAGVYDVYVTATATAESGFSDLTTPVKVGAFEITKAPVTITVPSTVSTNINGTVQLNAATDPVGLTLSYTSANLSVATVNQTGLVTGKAVGTAVITVSYAGDNNHQAAESKQVTVNVTDLPVWGIAFTSPTETVEFGGTVTNVATVTKPAGVTSDPAAPTYTSSDETVATVDASGTVTAHKAGTVTITASVAGVAGEVAENSASYTLTVTPKSITPTVELTGSPWTYTGSEIKPGVVVKNAESVLAEAEYDIGYDNNINAGTNTAHVTVSPAQGGNYVWDPVTTQFSIEKAAVATPPTVQKAHGTVTEGPQTYSIAALLSGYTNVTYGALTVSDDNGLLGSTVTISPDGVLSYTLTGTGEEGQTATVTVPVQSMNHQDFNLVFTITVKNLPEGAALAPIAVTLTQDAGTTYTVTITPQDGAEYSFDGVHWGPNNTLTGLEGGDSYIAYIRRAAVEDVSLEGPEQSTSMTIVPPAFNPNGGTFRGSQQVTLHAKDGAKIVYTTDGTEPTYNIPEDAEEPVISGILYDGNAFSITNTTTVKAIVVNLNEDGSVTSKSEVHSVTFTRRSTGGGGGGGGSTVINGGTASASKPSTSSTSTTPSVSSGRDTTTAMPNATVKDGAASANISGSLGQDLVNQAVENNSSTVVIAPSINGEADQTSVTIGSSVVGDISKRTDADLQVVTPAANVTISNQGLSSLASKGGSLVVNTAAKGGAIDVTITAGGSVVDRVSGGVTVEIPANCTAGTVAMLTKADGTTELLRKSVADAASGTVTVPLDGSASITLVDNSKSFGDVPAGNTFANAVAFVSSREIMNGTSSGVFNPSAPMTRAQLAKVLHNLESNPAAEAGSFSDVTGDAWCAEAVQWASSKGIVTGYADGSFKPNNYITREQLAVMLYRYAGSPAVSSTDLRFNDASLVGGYAQAAMAWATQNGVINGKGGNMLDPKGQATRAQVAQMLLNYMSNIG